MSKTPNYDAKVTAILDSTKLGEITCPISLKKWELTREELELCRKFNVPPIGVCPFMRLKLMAAWCGGVDLWWKPHCLTHKPVLSAVHPDVPVPVVPDLEWWANDYAEQFGLKPDNNLPFFKQFEKLSSEVPLPAFDSNKSENTIGGGYSDCVNSFMVFGTWAAKNSFYVFRNNEVDRVMDGVSLKDCQDSFSSAMCVRVYKCVQAFECIDCINSQFIFDCRNCEDCFCSTNLRRRKFVFCNEQLSEIEYRDRISKIDLSSTSAFEHWKKVFREMIISEAVFPEHNNVNSKNCVGDYLADCVNSKGYFMSHTNDLHEGWFNFDVERSGYVLVGRNTQNCWYTSVPQSSDGVKFSWVSLNCQNCEYVSFCSNCENCFGCVGLRNKRFCILNTQYDEKDYWEKLDEIKCAMLDRREYGHFLPLACSSKGAKTGFCSLAAQFTEDEIERAGGLKTDPVEGMRYAPYAKDATQFNVSSVPDKISEVDSSWVNVQFDDSLEKRRFSVPSHELSFRKEKGYPFPRRHYRARLIELFNQINSPVLDNAVCAKCGKQITVHKNNLFENRKVYCYDDYLKFLDEKN